MDVATIVRHEKANAQRPTLNAQLAEVRLKAGVRVRLDLICRRSRDIFVMAGHEGGIVTFGKSLEAAFAVLIRERKQVSI